MNKKNRNSILALILALLLIAALAACGTPAEAPAEAPAEQSAETPAAEAPAGQAAESADVLTNDGVKLPIPEEYKELLLVKTLDNDSRGYLFEVSEKASVESGKKQGYEEDSGIGWIFSIGRVSDEASKKMRCSDMSGAQLFAKAEDGTHYVFYHATDVTLMRDDMNNMSEADQKQWSDLHEWAWGKFQEDFIQENGLTKEVFGNTDLDIVLARIAFEGDVKYTVSTTEFGPMEPKDVDPAPYLDKLMNGVSYSYMEGEAPDGEYIVLSLPDEDMRFDFYPGNIIRRAYGDSDEGPLFKAVFDDGKTDASEVMQAWYDALKVNR